LFSAYSCGGIGANPKQHWVLSNIIDLPFNNYEIKTASCREGDTAILAMLEPDTSAFHCDIININKLKHKVEIYYDFLLEFVFTEDTHLKPFLEFLQQQWKGEWKQEN